jgi:hypothetical protein
MRAGGNCGWNLRKAAHAFTLAGGPSSGPSAELSDPSVEYPHTEDWGKSITGGAVYRGSKNLALDMNTISLEIVSAGEFWR